MTTLFIRYKDVCKLANLKNVGVLKKLHSQKKFKKAFQLIFNFKDKKTVDILLNNWDVAINGEIKNCKNVDLINNQEEYQIKRITLVELTIIANLGKYTINILKMKPCIAMAFTLGIYYSTFIFEPTGMNLTVNEIYDIIPLYKRTKTGYKKFLIRFFKDGTSKDILRILSQTKEV
jgi:hypothetical protein|tara:strand:- start:83 stop:610 length:528 start_codon:yes stop_codon:yes gene_type:complete